MAMSEDFVVYVKQEMNAAETEFTASGSDEGEGNMVPKENFNAEDPISNAQKNHRSHRNILERKRKEKIKMYISHLKDMIPPDYLPSMKKPSTNNAVLEQAVSYMKHLKQQSALFFANNGSQAQSEEIARLKKELEAVTHERDIYRKMVDNAAAITPDMIASALGSRNNTLGNTFPDHSSDSTPTPLDTASTASIGQHSTSTVLTEKQPGPSNSQAKLPGQGLIITQSGQAYYVNEQGIPIAQGIAPSQFLPEALLPRSSSASSSPVQTTNGSQLSIAPAAQSGAPATVVTTTATITPVVTSTAITTSVTLSTSSQQPASVIPATPVSNSTGLVAIPGHTGNLPSAIILPNGQIIPVVGNQGSSTAGNTSTGGNNVVQSNTSINSSLGNSSAVVTTGTSTSIVSTAHNTSTTDLAMSTSANVVLIGSQNPPINNVVMGSSQGQPPLPDPGNQLGRKIMPKPTPQLFTAPFPTMMAPITLTPLPIPACSISVGPPPFQTKPTPPVQNEPESGAKKKRPRKKKVKDPAVTDMPPSNAIAAENIVTPAGPLPSPCINSVPAPMTPAVPVMPGGMLPALPGPPPMPQTTNGVSGQSESDILATATASLFSPKHSTTDPLNLQASISEGNPMQNPIFDPTKQTVPTIPLTGTRARRTRKRKNREAKLAEEKEKAAQASSFMSQNVTVGEKGLPSVIHGLSTGMDMEGKTSKKSRATSGDTETEDMPALHELTGEEPEQTANASQSIEFDPNDLDNILDQVENIDSQQKQPSPEASGLALAAERLPKTTVEETDGYQVVNGDEEIGPVFTTKPKTPTMELMTPGKTLNAPDNNKIPNTPSYIGSSESYLIGNLTKSTDQPVDHRRQVASRSVPANDTSVNIFDAYSKPTSSFQPYSKPKHTGNDTPHSSSNDTEDSGLPDSTKEVNVSGLYKPRVELESPATDKYDSNSPWSSYSSVSVKRQNETSSPMDWLSENKPAASSAQPKPDGQQNKESQFNIPSDYSYAPVTFANQSKPVNHAATDDQRDQQQNAGFNRQHSMSQSQNSNPSPRSTASSGSAPAWSPARESEWNHTTKLPKPQPAKSQHNVSNNQDMQSQPKTPVDLATQSYQHNQFNSFNSEPPAQALADDNHLRNQGKVIPPTSYSHMEKPPFSQAQSPHDLSQPNQNFAGSNLGYQPFSRNNSDSGVWQKHSFSSQQQNPNSSHSEINMKQLQPGNQNKSYKVQRQPPPQETMPPQTSQYQLQHSSQSSAAGISQQSQPRPQLNHPQHQQNMSRLQQSDQKPQQKSKRRADSISQPQTERPLHQPYQQGGGLPVSQISNPLVMNQSVPQSMPVQSPQQSLNFLQQAKPQQSQNKQPHQQQIPNRFQHPSTMSAQQHMQQPQQHNQPNMQRQQSQQSTYQRSDSMQSMPESPLNMNSAMQPQNDRNNKAQMFNQSNQYYGMNPQTTQQDSQHNMNRRRSIEDAARPASRESSTMQSAIPGGRLGALLSLGSPQKAAERGLQPPPPNQNKRTSTSKANNVFSAESLLSKDNANKNLGLLPQFSQPNDLPRGSNSLHRPTAMNADLLQQLERDKTFRSTQSNEPPFNVNLFASTAPDLATLKHSLPSSFGLGYNDPSFTFSLTRTSTGPPTSSMAGSTFIGKHFSQQSLHQPMSQQSAQPTHDSIGMMSRQSSQMSGRASVEKDNLAQLHSRLNPSSGLDLGLYNPHHGKTDLPNQPAHRPPSQPQQHQQQQQQQQPPPLVKTSKRNNSSTRSTPNSNPVDVAKEMSSLPYSLGQSPYGLASGIPPFSMAKPTENTNPNFFSPQAMYNKSSAASFGLPFQPPGFPPMPSTNQHNLMQQIGSSQMNPSMPGFDINNLMKSKGSNDPTAAFKLGASEQSALPTYPTQPSQLYANPMNINNLFGGVAGFDANRQAMPGFPHPSPAGFPGFNSPFDLNLTNQP